MVEELNPEVDHAQLIIKPILLSFVTTETYQYRILTMRPPNNVHTHYMIRSESAYERQTRNIFRLATI